MIDGRDVERAIDALRRGWVVTIDGEGFLPIETTDEEALARFDSSGPANLLISGNRAAILKLANQREAAPVQPVLIERSSWIGLAAATAIADPQRDLQTPLKGPFRALPVEVPAAVEAAIRLARLAGLLPAFFVGRSADDSVSLTSGAVLGFDRPAEVRIASRAKLPTSWNEQGEILAFRSAGEEHVALVIGSPTGEPPLVRIHSECLTGDVLGSLKCDCGPQLQSALAAIRESGWGILLYLRQEGRGIGLVNKLRAYALQDQGFDTVDANLRLGFEDDERDFGVAAAMLRTLGRHEVRLLTNNPRKGAALEAAGVEVTEITPLRVASNAHNEGYLDTKRRRSGHQL